MSLPMVPTCGTCPTPGVCCRRFVLHNWGGPLTFYKERVPGDRDPASVCAEHALPFRFVAWGVSVDDGGREYGVGVFTCDRVTVDGRCGDYENRPELCRTFGVGEDAGCYYHECHALRDAAFKEAK